MSRHMNRPIAVHEIIDLSNKTALFIFFFLVSHEYLNSFDVNKPMFGNSIHTGFRRYQIWWGKSMWNGNYNTNFTGLSWHYFDNFWQKLKWNWVRKVAVITIPHLNSKIKTFFDERRIFFPSILQKVNFRFSTPSLQPHFGLYLKTTIINSRLILPDHIIYINFLDLISIVKLLILVKLYPFLLQILMLTIITRGSLWKRINRNKAINLNHQFKPPQSDIWLQRGDRVFDYPKHFVINQY